MAMLLSDKHLREAKYRSTLETELNLENYIEVLNQVIKDKNKDLEHLKKITSKKHRRWQIASLAVFETMIFAVGAFILVGPELIAANLITNSLIETVSITKYSLLASTMLILFIQLIIATDIKDFFKYFKDKKEKVATEEQIVYLEEQLSLGKEKLAKLQASEEDLTIGINTGPINILDNATKYRNDLQKKLKLLQAISLIRQNKKIIDKDSEIANLLKGESVSEELKEELTRNRKLV